MTPAAEGTGWELSEARAGTAALHAREGPDGRRRLVVCWPTDAAVVLGSTQPAADLDQARCRDEGLVVTRRRSGGGAVLVEPGAQVWVDFDISRGDCLFSSDISASFDWVGQLWAEAIRAALPGAGEVEVAPAVPGALRSPAAKVLCFGAVGAGEVLVDGRKVVGLSQRRDRVGARFHTVAVLRDTSERLLAVLSEPARRRLGGGTLAVAGSLRGGPESASELVRTLTVLAGSS